MGTINWLLLSLCLSLSSIRSDDHVVSGKFDNDLLFNILSHPAGNMYRSEGCHTTELHLSCPPHNMLIVHSAFFKQLHHNDKLNCSDITKHSIGVGRCSGYSRGEECKFSLLLDVVESEISLLTPTYLMSPSYPKYYQPGLNCSWVVSVPPHQRIISRVLDSHLRTHDACQDVLTLGDTWSGTRDTRVCGEIRTEVTRISQSHKLNIVFTTARDQSYILPYRGFLVEIIPGGCTPETPPLQSELSYLLSYNQSFAVYKCRSGHVFADSLETEKALMCIGHQYDQTLPRCVPSPSTGGSGHGMVSLPVLHDIVLPTIVTMFTVVLSIAACILLIIIKRQWETVPEYHSQQVGAYLEQSRSSLQVSTLDSIYTSLNSDGGNKFV